jgi:hypothetical protein
MATKLQSNMLNMFISLRPANRVTISDLPADLQAAVTDLYAAYDAADAAVIAQADYNARRAVAPAGLMPPWGGA